MLTILCSLNPTWKDMTFLICKVRKPICTYWIWFHYQKVIKYQCISSFERGRSTWNPSFILGRVPKGNSILDHQIGYKVFQQCWHSPNQLQSNPIQPPDLPIFAMIHELLQFQIQVENWSEIGIDVSEINEGQCIWHFCSIIIHKKYCQWLLLIKTFSKLGTYLQINCIHYIYICLLFQLLRIVQRR